MASEEGRADLLDPYEKLISLEIMGTRSQRAGEEPPAALLSIPVHQYHLLRRLLLER
jgi:hypothetical protein